MRPISCCWAPPWQDIEKPNVHARIKSIDANCTMARPEVNDVVAAADLPGSWAGLSDQEERAIVNYAFYSRNVMVRGTALYRGHAISAVAATSPHVAEEALSLIDVDCETLPPVLDT